MKAIVVDDAKAMRLLVSNWLREASFQVIEAVNGREAWTMLRTSGCIDLAIVDLNMPVMTGPELVVKLRTDPKFESTKILITSSEGGEVQMSRSLASGVDGYLAKPISEDSLHESLLLLGFHLD
jgi:two-component system, chemotaxis family, chemotaxis protein CheY